MADGQVSAIVLNSGGANCYTGPEGFQTTHATAEAVADKLGISAGDVIVCSTGLIGEQLDRAKVLAGVEAAVASLHEDGGFDASEAIMTTDSKPKRAVIKRDGWSIGGMAKGAGMLALRPRALKSTRCSTTRVAPAPEAPSGSGRRTSACTSP
jgi:glutamate N-acetyltransferase/amino-acid N-acetyltransferase